MTHQIQQNQTQPQDTVKTSDSAVEAANMSYYSPVQSLLSLTLNKTNEDIKGHLQKNYKASQEQSLEVQSQYLQNSREDNGEINNKETIFQDTICENGKQEKNKEEGQCKNALNPQKENSKTYGKQKRYQVEKITSEKEKQEKTEQQFQYSLNIKELIKEEVNKYGNFGLVKNQDKTFNEENQHRQPHTKKLITADNSTEIKKTGSNYTSNT